MANDDHDPAFADLEQRIRAAKQKGEPVGEGDGTDPDRPKLNFGTGLTVGIELVVGVVAGVGIGLALDSWLETRPFLTILLFLLGTAAGMLNAWRHLVRIGMVDPKGDGGGRQGRGPD
ncbi:MAG TPA: AtpZ/AtpI family protein [Geminicoccus sp.]|jgi:ATP synthase protein I|uniref:AtpZ/AtpI family protein n=1 Tax=Geminicoccus sp. TaxID=2024832 RepID=UPI002E35A02C|nr:AtpZ/AtpI family protein [Geminicoccus sp.]HEX2524970.1 AtpZ/AtpI family protein [Geminicoccus sp.]